MKKRFSMRKKLLLIFSTLILTANVIQGILAARTARLSVMDSVRRHLTDKAQDVANLIDARLETFFQLLEDTAKMPELRSSVLSKEEQLKLLQKEAALNEYIAEFVIADMRGTCYASGGFSVSVSDRQWYNTAVKGKRFVSEPMLSKGSNNVMITFAVPIYNANEEIIGVLAADTKGTLLSAYIADIVVGKTGYCYLMGETGNNIAHPDYSLVLSESNPQKEALSNPSLKSLAEFEKLASESETSSIGYYTYDNVTKIASYAKMKTADWTVIINAPIDDFMDAVKYLRINISVLASILLVLSIIIVYLIARQLVRPVQHIVAAFKDIAQGDGDLTVRLPVKGNDEVTDLSEYFNRTISKIGNSIKAVEAGSEEMSGIGSELASNMTETASAINEISANIDGVKQQTHTQAQGVHETASTIERIIYTIKQLNDSIESQAASVAESSSAIEEMVANIASITHTLEKTDGVIKTLATATSDGKETIAMSGSVTQRIAEESGSLMEASSVIQHIASQTNLLAMNAAIEAAHAGEAGKGFAVVADEIRKLAEESSSQGKTITSTLKVLGGEIEMLSTAAKTVEDKFSSIFNLSEQVEHMSARLMEAMKEQESASKEVLLAIREINTITVQVNDGSAEMLRGGENVAQQMQTLAGLTQMITDSMNEMSAGATQINNAVHEVNEITQKNKQSIDKLSVEVKKFKV